MAAHRVFLLTSLLLASTACASMDISSFMSQGQRKKAEKMSGEMNDAIVSANEQGFTGIKPLSEQEGPMRLFFTATPSPSVTPTPSVTPSPSETPSPTITPTTSPTPSASSSTAPTVTPSKSPSPTPFRNRTPPPRVIDVPGVGEAEVLAELPAEEATFNEDGSLTTAVDLSGNELQPGDQGALNNIEITPVQPSTTNEGLGVSRFLLPNVLRQSDACTVTLTIGFGAEARTIVEDMPIASNCFGPLRVIRFPFIAVAYTITDGSPVIPVFAEINCEADRQCPAVDIYIPMFLIRPIEADPSPSPTPSQIA